MSQFEKGPTCPSCNADASEDFIVMHSGVNMQRRGFVHVAWGSLRAQFTPAQARDHAFALLQAAEAAESDAIVFRLLEKRVGLDPARAMAVIGELRQFRDDALAKKGEP